MIRDITIGQYYPANSKLHRLDPRVKIMCTLFYLISLFLFKSVLGYAIATVFLAAVIRISKVPLKFILKGLKPIIMLLMLKLPLYIAVKITITQSSPFMTNTIKFGFHSL